MPATLDMMIRGWYTDELQILCKFSWDPRFPSAVSITFIDAGNVIWTMDRDLLALGLFVESGEGDVVISPVDDRAVGVLLRTAEGQAKVVFDKHAVAQFIHATFLIVPRGQEFAQVDWDKELSNLTE